MPRPLDPDPDPLPVPEGAPRRSEGGPGDGDRENTTSHVFSFSRLKTFAQCPLRHRYRYLEGRREAFSSVESFVGRTTHAVLEWLYAERDRGASPELPAALEQLARRWSEAWSDEVAVVRVGESPEDAHRLAREMLARFHRDTFSQDRSTTVALEKRVSFRLEGDVTFVGFADRVGRTHRGRLFVVDYKTSRSEGNGSDFSEGLQTPLYAACVLDDHGEQEALAGYHYLRHGTTSWQSVTNGRRLELLERYRALVSEVLAAVDHPPRPGVLCAWCGFNHICPAAQVPDHLAGGLAHARRRLACPD